ncbi:cupredoxin domain-containing protein [Novosphingobium sp. BL-52-GroH]|uniref:cupredoxin domain-containing protein n=1 Tax=Novosphingobium sp. BL-52-GroH TaxID=3349877 RepID=UPI00384C56DA
MIVWRLVAAAALTLATQTFAPAPAMSQAPSVAAGPGDVSTLTVQLSNFQFSPSTITLDHGRAYALRFENLASGGHDFAAKDFFAAATIPEADRGRIVGGAISLKGGQSVEVHLVAPPTGTYKVRCTHFMHGAFGMTGKIVVQ